VGKQTYALANDNKEKQASAPKIQSNQEQVDP
jgi:hypothetical protein